MFATRALFVASMIMLAKGNQQQVRLDSMDAPAGVELKATAADFVLVKSDTQERLSLTDMATRQDMYQEQLHEGKTVIEESLANAEGILPTIAGKDEVTAAEDGVLKAASTFLEEKRSEVDDNLQASQATKESVSEVHAKYSAADKQLKDLKKLASDLLTSQKDWSSGLDKILDEDKANALESLAVCMDKINNGETSGFHKGDDPDTKILESDDLSVVGDASPVWARKNCEGAQKILEFHGGEPVTWQEADEQCWKRGGNLVTFGGANGEGQETASCLMDMKIQEFVDHPQTQQHSVWYVGGGTDQPIPDPTLPFLALVDAALTSAGRRTLPFRLGIHGVYDGTVKSRNPVENSCPFQIPTGYDDMQQCGDGSLCNVVTQGDGCCHLRGRKAHCPKNAPHMCKKKDCGMSDDYCCAADCSNLGGNRPCSTPDILPQWFYSDRQMCDGTVKLAEHFYSGTKDYNEAVQGKYVNWASMEPTNVNGQELHGRLAKQFPNHGPYFWSSANGDNEIEDSADPDCSSYGDVPPEQSGYVYSSSRKPVPCADLQRYNYCGRVAEICKKSCNTCTRGTIGGGFVCEYDYSGCLPSACTPLLKALQRIKEWQS